MDGPNARSGRVEIKHKGVWGTVCEDNFGLEEAQVVCTMLGFPAESASLYNGSRDYRGDGPIWIRFDRNEGCSGHEISLTECKSKNLWEHTEHCKHHEDVAIVCQSEVSKYYSLVVDIYSYQLIIFFLGTICNKI